MAALLPGRRAPSVAMAVITALALFSIGTVGAIRAGLGGASFMYDLEQVRPPLVEAPIIAAPPPPARLAKRVIIMIIDGLRYDASRSMPHLTAWRNAGVDLNAHSHYPTWSRPNYVSILTGVPPQASGVRTNMHHTPVQLDTLMDRAHASGLRVAVAADNEAMPKLFLRPSQPGVTLPDDFDFDVLEDPLSEEALSAADFELISPFDDARYVPWPGGLADAGHAQLAGNADLVVLLIGAVDQAGHAYGAASEEYAAATAIADRAVARALRDIDLTQDALVIVADHGHSDRGGHGGLEPEVVRVPMIWVGAGIRPGAFSNDPGLIDVAPTVSALLGMSPPQHGLGRTLTEVLNLPVESATTIGIADTLRQESNQQVVDRAIAKFNKATLARRALRIGITLAVAAFVLLLAWLAWRAGGLRVPLRVLLLVVPSFFVVYYTLIGTLGQGFSPSLLPARGHLALELGKYGAIGTAVHLLVSWLVLRRRKNLADRFTVANGIALVGLMFTMLPAALLWAAYPPPYTVVPGPALLVIIPAVQVAVACYALGVALSLLIEVLVFGARFADPARRRAREQAAGD